jgi:sugar O-acyltransferase (sialic acid O-acetyltransferase NeuD family)
MWRVFVNDPRLDDHRGMDSTIGHAAVMMPSCVGLLGAGSQAREVASYLPPGTKVFWAVAPDYLDPAERDQVDITSPSAAARNAWVVGAVGAPALRRDLIAAWPGDRFVTVVSPTAYVDPSCRIGAGSVIAPGAVLTVDVVVGEHCLVNIGATLSHDVHLAPFVTIGPGAHLAGRVRLGEGVFVGVGASISNDVTLASGVVVGAGATVLTDVMIPNAVVVGVPASVVKVREGWLDAL